MNELLAPRTPGAALKAAREKHKWSITDVCDATRIKPHIIQALEQDDYSAITAPLYGKSFIRLYASHLGLDPAPLIQYYLDYYARTVRPTLKTEVPPPSAVNDGIPQPSPLARFKESSDSALTDLTNSVTTVMRDAIQGLVRTWKRMQTSGQELSRGGARSIRDRMSGASEPIPAGRFAAIGFAALVVIMLVVSAVYYWAAGSREDVAIQTAARDQAPKVVTASRPLRLAAPPPAPYLKLK